MFTDFNVSDLEEFLETRDNERDTEWFNTDHNLHASAFENFFRYMEEKKTRSEANTYLVKLKDMGYDISSVTFKGK